MFNRGAEALLQAGDGIRSVNDRLACARPSEHNALVALLSATVACGVHSAAAAGGSLQVHRREPSPPLTLSVSPFHSTLPGRSAPLAALVFLIDASAPVRSRAATMRAIYGLTPTESRIADLLLQGMEIRGISGHLGTTLETARFHVKRILTKTGSRRQSELVRRMLALPSQSEQ
jgi:DNA-binding CsgD family transcriptional regulator